MNQKERKFIALVLALVAAMVAMDLMTDAREGIHLWHLVLEGALGFAALLGIYYLFRESFKWQRQLETKTKDFAAFQLEAESWRAQAKKYIQGLADSIDHQLSKWHLSTAEKEVAFLLLKGLSLKEIAVVRQTAEKTVRVQATAIYAKSGLAGRSELAAFFLEDLLLPAKGKN